ncbi:MAG: branched-chain amino acid ABC transporter permease [Alphaproteobacteria bacterium]
MTRHLTPVLAMAILGALSLVPLAVWAFDAPFYLDLFNRVMIYAIAAVSLNLVMGYGGLVSFGHAAFLGIGGYAVGILTSHEITSGYLQWPAAMLAAALFALATGTVVLRTTGVHFIMITLAFAQMLFFLFTSLESYGGDDGMTLWSRSSFPGLLDLENDTVFYYVVFAVLLGALALSHRVVESRFGRVLRGAKENDRRMRAIGFPTFRYRLVAYALSGALSGLAGALLTNATQFVGPNMLSWARSGEIMVMVLLGGLGTIFGPLFGAVAYVLLSHFLADLTKHWHIIMGPFLVLVALYARGGLHGLVARLGRRP